MNVKLWNRGRGRLSFAPLLLLALLAALPGRPCAAQIGPSAPSPSVPSPSVPYPLVPSPFPLLPAALHDDEITLLDGVRFTAVVEAIDADGAVHFAGDRAAVDLQGLRRIDRPDVATAVSGPAWSLPKVAAHKPADDKREPGVEALVHLSAGGTVRAAGVTLDGGVVSIDLASGNGWRLPTAAVRAIAFATVADTPMAPQAAVFDDAVNDADAQGDRLIAVVGDKLQPISGILRQVTAEHIVFEWQGKARNVARSKVYALVLAATGRTPGKLGRCHVHTVDGSSLWGRVARLDGGELELELLPAEKDTSRAAVTVNVPWATVWRVDVRSNRLVYLSDVEPLRTQQQPIVTLSMPHRRDRSVSGGELKLGDRTFARGLGVHARSLLEYEAGRAFDVFSAVIGLDASVGEKGDCEFVVLGDGRELFRKRMRGGEPAHEIEVDITGVDRLTLLVEPGEDLDLADHANWCEARMIRTGDGG